MAKEVASTRFSALPTQEELDLYGCSWCCHIHTNKEDCPSCTLCGRSRESHSGTNFCRGYLPPDVEVQSESDLVGLLREDALPEQLNPCQFLGFAVLDGKTCLVLRDGDSGVGQYAELSETQLNYLRSAVPNS